MPHSVGTTDNGYAAIRTDTIFSMKCSPYVASIFKNHMVSALLTWQGLTLGLDSSIAFHLQCCITEVKESKLWCYKCSGADVHRQKSMTFTDNSLAHFRRKTNSTVYFAVRLTACSICRHHQSQCLNTHGIFELRDNNCVPSRGWSRCPNQSERCLT